MFIQSRIAHIEPLGHNLIQIYNDIKAVQLGYMLGCIPMGIFHIFYEGLYMYMLVIFMLLVFLTSKIIDLPRIL